MKKSREKLGNKKTNKSKSYSESRNTVDDVCSEYTKLSSFCVRWILSKTESKDAATKARYLREQSNDVIRRGQLHKLAIRKRLMKVFLGKWEGKKSKVSFLTFCVLQQTEREKER